MGEAHEMWEIWLFIAANFAFPLLLLALESLFEKKEQKPKSLKGKGG